MHRNTHVNRGTCTNGGHIRMGHITPSHTRSHTLPPLPQGPHTPSHSRPLTHVSDVSRSKMPAGSTLIALPFRWRNLSTRRGGSQPSHTPPAHARCVHQHAHSCMCPMHMHHAHARVHRGSFSLCICAHCACVSACACVCASACISTHEYTIRM